MLRVYRSESPLLNYINAQFYRTPTMNGIRNGDGSVVCDQVNYLIANMDLSSKENYLDWVYTWKRIVADLSEMSHHLKRFKTYSIFYESTLNRTKKAIIAEWVASGKVVMCEDEGKILRQAADRIETFTAFLSTALTALYNARATGKLATSAIVMQSRDEYTMPRPLRNAA